MSRTHLDRLAIVLLVALSATWGIGQVAIKVGLDGISPIAQAALRSAGAAILLSAWMLARGQTLFPRDGHTPTGVIVGLLFALEFLLLFVGMQYTSASRAVVFLYTSPFVVAIGNHFFVAGDPLDARKMLGLVAAFAGIVFAFSEPGSLASLRGDVLVLLAALFWGATTVTIKATGLATISPERVLLYQLAVSALLLGAASIAVGEPGVFRWSPVVVTSLLYQAVIVAFASYLIWFWIIREYRASQASAYVFLTPFFGVAAGYLLLGDPLTARFAAALLLVAGGIFLVTHSNRG